MRNSLGSFMESPKPTGEYNNLLFYEKGALSSLYTYQNNLVRRRGYFGAGDRT